jgi:cytochrome c3-like protein
MSRSIVALAAVLAAAASTAGAQQQTRNPHGTLTVECATCHAPSGWLPARVTSRFNHAKQGFALVGAHAQASCRSCHVSLDFRGVATECSACHSDPHRAELGKDCARCHTPRSFLDRAVMAGAHQTTRFPLAGAHAAVDCETCHRPAQQGRMAFVSVPADCVSCHRPQYQAAKNPDHVAGGFPQDCVECHAQSTWSTARFNHDATRFALTGAHRAVTCQQCHGDGVFRGKSTACVSCHQQDYNGTTNPNHAAGGFSTTCQTCHTTVTWTGATFNHSATAFPLTGAHLSATCQQCHGDGVYAGKSTACASCHQTDYNNTTNPNHASAAFPTSCQTCHTTTSWLGATFSHTWFPVPHRTATDCVDCHTTPTNYSLFVCTNCHTKSTTDPHHTSVSGYTWSSTACYSCHRNAGGGG